MSAFFSESFLCAVTQKMMRDTSRDAISPTRARSDHDERDNESASPRRARGHGWPCILVQFLRAYVEISTVQSASVSNMGYRLRPGLRWALGNGSGEPQSMWATHMARRAMITASAPSPATWWHSAPRSRAAPTTTATWLQFVQSLYVEPAPRLLGTGLADHYQCGPHMAHRAMLT